MLANARLTHNSSRFSPLPHWRGSFLPMATNLATNPTAATRFRMIDN
jgi:hypothetical protein